MSNSAVKHSFKPAPAPASPIPRFVGPDSTSHSFVLGAPAENRVTQRRAAPHPHDSAHRAAAAGENLFHQRRFNEAVSQFQLAIRLAPQNPGFQYRLAYSAWRANQLSIVERHALAAIDLDPAFTAAHDLLGQWYLFSARYDLALIHSAKALTLAPDDAGIILSRAFVLAGYGDARGAWDLLHPVLADPALAERSTILYLQIAARIGKERDAAELALRHLARSVYPPPERPHLLFALAGLLDRLGRYDEAFAHVRAARQLIAVPYSPEEHQRSVSRRIDFYSPDRLRSLPRPTHPTQRPVFIVGMPRSGTSLVEQILASHPEVHGAGELNDLLDIAATIPLDGAAIAPPSFTQSSINALSARYLARIESLNSSTRYITDKMPLNFLELGLAQILFPGCRIIHCLRDPLDTCLSCYMTDIAAGVGFCRTQTTLAHYHAQYTRLMSHWRTVLTVPMLEVRYEDVVADITGQTRRILAFLNLPWHDRCTKFHENKRPVATASRDQVRQPLYGSSVGRWKHYQPHLGELEAALLSPSPGPLPSDNG